MYLKLFMCLHFVAAFVIFVLPKFIRGSSEKTSITTATIVTKDNNTLCKTENNNAQLNPNSASKSDQSLAVSSEQIENKPNGVGVDVDESSNSSFSSLNDISDKNHQRKIDTNFLLKDLINKEVSKIKGETDNFSNLLMEKIEAANIEGLFDKTVSGIVDFKDDLMRMNEPEVYSGNATEGLRKRNVEDVSLVSDTVDVFLKKEIDAIKEANVIPAVLSNGHAK